ncbi:YqhR family membrane protein [Peribacillus sp. NPDC097224]|uniref:YqhR family membrane protein n=1 Tax=Peribacillus sp. NPDC097224 TaxID=3364399 RepID=UPI003802285F
MSTNETGNHQQENKSLLLANVFAIGIFGGIFASLAGVAAHYFKFMEFSPKFILTSWSDMSWIDRWQGTMMTLLVFGILSIGVAFIYYGLLKKIKSIFAGLIYGVICWALLVFVFKPMFSDLPAVSKMSSNSVITSVCIFILYGLFVGYSISYDHQEYLRQKEIAENQSGS